VTFQASAKRARDTGVPIGLRVACLHECLEQFNLFGYRATRERLRLIVGASEPGWTSDQVLAALDELERAKSSWHEVEVVEMGNQAQLKASGHPQSPNYLALARLAWLEAFVRQDPGDCWQVGNVGACGECDHSLLHHGGHSCSACRATSKIPWCERQLPAPVD
jgi:hypothetical protein